MMANFPLVSILITSFNQKDLLKKAIDSALSQTYENIEIIIADDSSTDGSSQVIENYRKTYPEKIKSVISARNRGVAKNRNSGLEICKGEYITCLDGDDYIFSQKIEKEIKVFEGNSALDIVYSNFISMNHTNGEQVAWIKSDTEIKTGNIFEDVFLRNFPMNRLYRNELVRSSLFKVVQFYDDKLTTYEDWDLKVRMSKHSLVGYSDYVGSAYIFNPSGLSKVTPKKHMTQDMQYILQKNLHLVSDFSKHKKRHIARRILSLILETKLSNRESGFLDFLLDSVRYVYLSGNILYPLRVIKNSI